MRRQYPETKVTCANCLFCSGSPPVCVAKGLNRPVSSLDLWQRPLWCPFVRLADAKAASYGFRGS